MAIESFDSFISSNGDSHFYIVVSVPRIGDIHVSRPPPFLIQIRGKIHFNFREELFLGWLIMSYVVDISLLLPTR